MLALAKKFEVFCIWHGQYSFPTHYEFRFNNGNPAIIKLRDGSLNQSESFTIQIPSVLNSNPFAMLVVAILTGVSLGIQPITLTCLQLVIRQILSILTL